MVDLACVSTGFVLRAIAGGVATGVPLSDWFIIVSSFGALLIVTGKRSAEHAELGELRGAHRPTLERLSRGLPALGASPGRRGDGHRLLPVGLRASAQVGRRPPPRSGSSCRSCPFVLAILHVELRFARGLGGAPEELALRDRTLQLLGLVWVALVAVGIYA